MVGLGMGPESAEAFPPGEFIQDELDARGWTTTDLAIRMGGDPRFNKLVVDMLVHVRAKGLSIGEETAERLAKAFGVSKQFFLNLDKSWQDHPGIHTGP